MRRGVSRSETREYARSAAGLTVALGIAGVLTYVFFAIASRTLDGDAYGEVVVLWSIVFLLSSTLFRPIEQLLARTLAERDQAGAPAGDALRSAALIQLGICAVTLAALLIARGPLTEHVFTEDDSFYWAMLISLAGFALAFYARGFLAGRNQFRLYAALVIFEVSLRVLFAVAAAASSGAAVALVAVGIATSPIAPLLILPLAGRDRPAPADVAAGEQLTLGHGGAFAGAVLVMMLSEQILVGSGALFVRAAEGAAAAGYIFNVLMVARAPLVLFQAIAASLLPHLTRMRARDDDESRHAFDESLEATMILIAGFAALVTAGVGLVGPQVMQIAFGDQFEYDRLGLMIVAVGMGLYLVAASLNQAALAQGQAHRAARRWIVCAGAFVLFNLLAPISAERAVEIGFTACAGVLALLLYRIYADPHPDPGDRLEPGSVEEVQARLATSDEVA